MPIILPPKDLHNYCSSYALLQVYVLFLPPFHKSLLKCQLPQIYYLKMHLSFYKPLPYFYFLLIEFVIILHYISYFYCILTLKYEIFEDKDFVWHVYSFVSIT